MYIKTHNKEIGAKLAAHYQAGKPIEIMGKLFLGNSIGFEYPDSCVEFHGSEVSKVAWTGEGLPPVGTVCEFRRTMPGATWNPAKTLCVGEKRIFFRDKDGDELSRDHGEVEFRPIRTPDQIAAEERLNAIECMSDLVGDIDQIPTWTDALAKLYDAGYRKV